MPKFLKVSGFDGLVRDTSTGAILNTNKDALNQSIIRRKREKLLSQSSKNIEARINIIENKYDELNQKLNKILEILQK